MALSEKVGVVETAARFLRKRAGEATGAGLTKFLRQATLAPGVAVVGNAGSGGNTFAGVGGEITVNGQRTEANYFSV